ncbi:MAG: DUF6259 domain-containing protein [Candidatus Sumerlaeota bacterium]|nr:DUF6259 domain-containing protein [Candidatus Sumerlaeota bacterium]
MTVMNVTWLWFCCLTAGSAFGAAKPTADLAAGPTTVSFDSKTGAIAQITHRESGQTFVASDSSRPLFSLILSKPFEKKQMEADASEFRQIVVKPQGDKRLEINFADHPALPLAASVTAEADDDGLVHLRIAIANPSDWAVKTIRFPQFVSPPALGKDPREDRLLSPLPLSDGAEIWAPGTITQTKVSLYPNQACVQFSALYNKTAGLYLATYDPDGHCKQWGVRTVAGKSVEMPLEHLRPELPGEEAALPYDVVIGTFAGDWRDAAALYKRWAVRQPWCAKTLAERSDVPAFLKEGCGLFVGNVHREAERTDTMGRDLERLPELVAAYRTRGAMAHMMFVPYGWENRGMWAGIHYFPTVPSDADWRKANEALRAQGDRSCFLMSGYWWVVKRQQTQNGPAFDDTADFERRQEMLVQNADGTPWTIDRYNDTTGRMAWRGLSTELCHGSSEASKTLLGIFLDVARLGVPIISFDQEIGGGQHQPCYSKTHGHPPGYGNWMWTDFRDLCAEILKEGKPIQPELGLSSENCCELTIPYFATYWSRQFGVIDQGATNARGLGLFSYLYHEYVTAIGAACVQGQGSKEAQPPAEMRCYALAQNVVRGLIPGPFMLDVRLEASDAWHKTVAQAFFSYCWPYARFPEYLSLGAARRPPAIRCADVALPFYRDDAKGQPLRPDRKPVSKMTIAAPAVVAGSFQAADGSLGTVLVNATANPQQAAVKLGGQEKSATLYKADRTEVQKWLQAPAEVPVSLEPFETQVLVMR